MIIYRCLFPNDKSYIGQTNRTLEERKKEHLLDARKNSSILYNYPFYRAIRKYGSKSLVWMVIDMAVNQNELNNKEVYWIHYYNTYIKSENSKGYNQTIGGEGVNGLVHSNETKQHLSEVGCGENNSHAKLTANDVLQIVCYAVNNIYTQVELSFLYNTSEATISRILSGARWSSVTGIVYNG